MDRVENSSLTINAYAKLNLRLKVCGRRGDGYHLLSMLNVRIGLCDELELTFHPGTGTRFSLEGIATGAEGGDLSDPKENIVVRTIERFEACFGIHEEISIHLRKRIPVGAGLGGGSSDAAAVLGALAGRYDRTAPDDRRRIYQLAESLGADVPFFLLGRSAVVEGIGEQLTPIDIGFASGAPVFVVFPRIPLSTKRVFSVHAASHGSASGDDRSVPAAWGPLLECMENDLEGAACDMEPRVGEVLASLRAISGIRASMTGSGSALFCLSEQRAFSTAAARAVGTVAARFGCDLFVTEVI